MTDDTVTAKLAEWEALVEGATPGPWDNYRPNRAYRIYEVCATTTQGLNETLAEVSGYNADADAEFIAAAREMVPALLGFVEDVLALHRESEWLCGNARHTNPEVGCPECYTACETCDRTWPCPTVRALTDAIGGA